MIRFPVRAILAIAILAGVSTSCSGRGSAPISGQVPRLILDGSVAPDLQALAAETWDRFVQAFGARSDCFGDVTLRTAHGLESRAAYDPERAVVTVRVPATAGMLQSALIHEWAHHVEFQCPEHAEMRVAFLAAQGLPADTPWRPDQPPAGGDGPVSDPPQEGAWVDIPSEQYAEAAIEVVLGEQPVLSHVRLTAAAVEVVARWAAGEFP